MAFCGPLWLLSAQAAGFSNSQLVQDPVETGETVFFAGFADASRINVLRESDIAVGGQSGRTDDDNRHAPGREHRGDLLRRSEQVYLVFRHWSIGPFLFRGAHGIDAGEVFFHRQSLEDAVFNAHLRDPFDLRTQ